MNKRRLGAAAILAALGLTLAGVAAAAPASAAPPLTGSKVTITNFATQFEYDPGREVQVTFGYHTADTNDPGQFSLTIVLHNDCQTTTEVDQTFVDSHSGGASTPEAFSFPVPAGTGWADVTLGYSGGGTGDQTETLAATEGPTAADLTATIDPADPTVGDTGSIHLVAGDQLPVAHWRLLLDGVPNGPTRSMVGCSPISSGYSGWAPGTNAVVEFFDAGLPIANYTVPGGQAVVPPSVTPPASQSSTPVVAADPDAPTLAFTGVNPLLLVSVGGALLVAGGSIALLLWLRRRRLA